MLWLCWAIFNFSDMPFASPLLCLPQVGNSYSELLSTLLFSRKPSLGTLDHRGLLLHTAFLSPFLLQHLSPLKREKWKGCHSHQQLKPPLMVSRWALEGTWEGKNTCHLADQTAANSIWWTLRKLRNWGENTGYWPHIGEVHNKGIISVSPDSYIFPYIEKR